MWKNFPAQGVQDIHGCGVQKKNSEYFGKQPWSLEPNSLFRVSLEFLDKQTEHTSSFVHSFSTVAILKLLLCLFTSPEVVTITANLW
jgi:hypothetical protein